MKKRTRYVRIVGLGPAFTIDQVHPCQAGVISYLQVSGVSVECEVMELSLIYDLQNKYNFHSLTHWTEGAPQVVKIRAVFSIVTNSQWYWQLSEYWCQKDRKLFTFLCNQEIVKGDCVRWKTDANMLKRAFTSKSSNSLGSVAAAVNKEEQYLEPWLWFIIQACIKY